MSLKPSIVTAVEHKDGVCCRECEERVILRDEYKKLKCLVYPWKKLLRALEYLRWTRGHIIHISKGGTDDLDNLKGEHFWCNKEKKNQSSLPEHKKRWIKQYALKCVPELLKILKINEEGVESKDEIRWLKNKWEKEY